MIHQSVFSSFVDFMCVVIAMAIDINSNAYPPPILSVRKFWSRQWNTFGKENKKTKLRNRKNRLNLLFCLDFFVVNGNSAYRVFLTIHIFFFHLIFANYQSIQSYFMTFALSQCNTAQSIHSIHHKQKWFFERQMGKKPQSLWVDVRSRNGVLWHSKAARSNDQCNYN